ncbi:hypothetical protein F2Q70_00018069 [Brassica cretica]|uniref:Uncharacterized protein n=1 Tax=Brassica cretica TaxID=69181 RepID=A0A8S9KW19_BRACR|nr:hypothetical protein F2Q70_00018069 [Brassica cretica]KAF2598222.1 hypothetical protein F2Q68_00011056 [Brassica cretica]
MKSLGLGIDVVVSCLASFFPPEFVRRPEALPDVRRRQAPSIGLVGGLLVTSTTGLHEKLPSLPR